MLSNDQRRLLLAIVQAHQRSARLGLVRNASGDALMIYHVGRPMSPSGIQWTLFDLEQLLHEGYVRTAPGAKSPTEVTTEVIPTPKGLETIVPPPARTTEVLVPAQNPSNVGQRRPIPVVFIGHGHSPDWMELAQFVRDRLQLHYDEFNASSAAGLGIHERLDHMLQRASFAFLVMTAEDEHSDNSLHARENVIHEAGLFQGRLGFRRAVIVLESECKTFSNVAGLGYIRFSRGLIKATFEEVRQVLEREGVLVR